MIILDRHLLYLIYILISVFLSVYSVLYIFSLFYFGRKIGKRQRSSLSPGNLTVLIPVYKEKPEIFKKCIRSVASQKARLVVVGDGCSEPYKSITKENGGMFIYLPKNNGKKAALSEGIKRIKTDYVMLLDSDTILSKNAVKGLLAGFDDRVGGVGAEIKIIKKKNKFIYYSSEMLQRLRQLSFKPMSYFGKVMVLNGQCSVYRTKLIKDFVSSDSFLNAKFMGKKVNNGDDALLTRYVNSTGYKTKMMQNVLVYTDSQDSFKKLIKQTVRWSRTGYMYFFNDLKSGNLFKNGVFYAFSLVYIYTLPLLTLVLIVLRGGLLLNLIFRRGVYFGWLVFFRSLIQTPAVLSSFALPYTGLRVISILAGILMIVLLVRSVEENKIRFLSYGSIMLLVMLFSAIYGLLSISRHNQWMTR